MLRTPAVIGKAAGIKLLCIGQNAADIMPDAAVIRRRIVQLALLCELRKALQSAHGQIAVNTEAGSRFGLCGEIDRRNKRAREHMLREKTVLHRIKRRTQRPKMIFIAGILVTDNGIAFAVDPAILPTGLRIDIPAGKHAVIQRSGRPQQLAHSGTPASGTALLGIFPCHALILRKAGLIRLGICINLLRIFIQQPDILRKHIPIKIAVGLRDLRQLAQEQDPCVDLLRRGEKLLIPMNMRDGSLICTGKGNDDWNQSAPHGAGRLMSRAEAKSSFTVSEFKKQMSGIFTTSVSSGTLDECPMAYKPMEAITSCIGDTVEINEIIRPIYNFKAGDEE